MGKFAVGQKVLYEIARSVRHSESFYGESEVIDVQEGYVQIAHEEYKFAPDGIGGMSANYFGELDGVYPWEEDGVCRLKRARENYRELCVSVECLLLWRHVGPGTLENMCETLERLLVELKEKARETADTQEKVTFDEAVAADILTHDSIVSWARAKQEEENDGWKFALMEVEQAGLRLLEGVKADSDQYELAQSFILSHVMPEG